MAPLPEPLVTPVIRPDVRSALRALSRREGWGRLAPVVERHGAGSEQCRLMIVALLGTRPCPVCGRAVCAATKRVVHCSDRCRRCAGNHAGQPCRGCGIPLIHRGAARCRACYTALRRARMAVPLCADCGRPISRHAARCRRCAVPYRLAARRRGGDAA